MKIINLQDAINRRLYNNQSFVLTLIHRVSCLNRTVVSFPVSDWECHPKGSASLAGGRAARSSIS
ncbi:hypothetical protein [Nostoc sp.]|uniref:hypothetical protein n=1 Tax=Nostoc sp. TaxID=1180 RepID=UPI002FF837BB